MDSQTLALILLIMRVIAVFLIGATLIRQISNLRNRATDFPAVRWAIFALTLILWLGQFIPIILDSSVTFFASEEIRKSPPNLLGSSYAINNAAKDIVIGALLGFLYFRPGADRRKPPKRRV